MSNADVESKESGEGVEKTFPLLDLPAELWSKIGKLVIDATPVITVVTLNDFQLLLNRRKEQRLINQIRQHFGSSPRPVAPIHATAGQPAISRTCQVLRLELLPYYYRHNVRVSFGLGDRTFAIKNWLGTMGAPNRRNIIRLSFLIEHGEDLEGQKRALAKDFTSFQYELRKIRGKVVDGDGYEYHKYKVVLL